MSALSNDLERKIVRHFLRNEPESSPAQVFLALFSADPGEEGDQANEVSYDNYVRQVAQWSTLDSNGQTKNTTTITFPANGNASTDVTVTHAAIFDITREAGDGSAGNMLLYGPLASPKTLAPGDVLSFAANALTLTLD